MAVPTNGCHPPHPFPPSHVTSVYLAGSRHTASASGPGGTAENKSDKICDLPGFLTSQPGETDDKRLEQICAHTHICMWYWDFELLARQALWHSNQTPSPFFASIIFSDGGLASLPGAGLGLGFSYLQLLGAGMTETCHRACLICWDGILITFCLDWPQNMIRPTSHLPSSKSHCTQPFIYVFMDCVHLVNKWL
jgi:hypothetical protein